MTDLVLFLIIGLTGLATYFTWQDKSLFYKYQFNAYMVYHRKEFVRMFSHAFLHVGWAHLIINMLVLYSFGRNVLYIFSAHPSFNNHAVLHFILLYVGGIIVSCIFSLFKHKDNPSYNAVGASGAVSAVAFASIFFIPYKLVYFFGVIPIPGILFGVLYLIYSYRMGKKGTDNIGHDAHFWGAIFGLIYPILVDPSLLRYFIQQLLNFNI